MVVAKPLAGNPWWHPLSSPTAWTQVSPDLPEVGRLVPYYSEDAALRPVRHITRINDNKSDPNLETMTFGMFSTCDMAHRRNMAIKNGRYLFFRTMRDNESVLAGYYEIGWYLPSWALRVSEKQVRAQLIPDYFLAAKQSHWVRDPIPMKEVAAALGRRVSWLKIRAPRILSADDTLALRKLLKQQADASDEYLGEIRFMEEFQASRRPDKLRYVNWRRSHGFTWEDAVGPVNHAHRTPPTPQQLEAWNRRGIAKNQWTCDDCDTRIHTKRSIKLCSHCSTGGRMRPLFLDEVTP